MRYLFIMLIWLNAFAASSQPEKKLAEAFIQSIATTNFKLLEPYIYNAPIAKKIFGSEFGKMPPAKQFEAIKRNKTSLQNKWEKVVANAKENKIDFNKVHIKQVLSGRIEGNNFLNSLLATYEYNNTEWDDLLFIINSKGISKYIVDIPNNTAMFAMNESRRGRNVKELQMAADKNDPAIKVQLKNTIEMIRKFIANNEDEQLYKYLVYTGEEDKDNRWKRTIDASKPEDIQSSKRIIKKLKDGFENCKEINYEAVRIEKESEGIWYVINAACSGHTHSYAFLKINKVFVLGDID